MTGKGTTPPAQRYALPIEWERAIRADAGSWIGPNLACQRIEINTIVFSIHRATLRVYHGESLKEFYKDRPEGAAMVEWVKRRPRCQACGTLIDHLSKVVAYTYRRPGSTNEGRQCFIHESCPEEAH